MENIISDALNHGDIELEDRLSSTPKTLLVIYTALLVHVLAWIHHTIDNKYSTVPFITRIKHVGFNFLLKIPVVGSKIQAELDDAGADVRTSISFNPRTQDSLPPGITEYKRSIPDKGCSNEEIIKELTDLKLAYDDNLSNQKCGNLQMYYNDEELLKLHIETYKMFTKSNMLHADHFKAARKLEAEVCRQVLRLYNGDDKTAAVHTTGGTESILLSMLAWRNHWADRHNFDGKCPEIILSTTAHPAFDRACNYYGIKMVKIEANPETQKVDSKKVAVKINSNTLGIVAPHRSIHTEFMTRSKSWQIWPRKMAFCCTLIAAWVAS